MGCTDRGTDHTHLTIQRRCRNMRKALQRLKAAEFTLGDIIFIANPPRYSYSTYDETVLMGICEKVGLRSPSESDPDWDTRL